MKGCLIRRGRTHKVERFNVNSKYNSGNFENDFAATAGIFLCHTGVCNYYNKFPILLAHTIHAP